jgi:C_GCAxxG_C_C family probable redox protein
MSNHVTAATDLFLKGYNCAQSVLYTFKEESGLPESTALKMASGFGAGMARKEEVCGAVTGGIMVLGLRHGRGAQDGREATELTYQKTRELMDRFAAKHGSYVCRQLLDGCELTTEAGRQYFKENNLLHSVCKACVQSVVEILEQIK